MPADNVQLTAEIRGYSRSCVGVRKEFISPIGSTVTYYTLEQPMKHDSNPLVLVFLASAGREASDFNELAESLNVAGYYCVLVQAPLIDGSNCAKENPNLFDLAQDLPLEAIRTAKKDSSTGIPTSFVFIGHAYGNRVTRAAATLFPKSTAGVILLAAGGKRPVPIQAREALRKCFDHTITTHEHREAVKYAFFARCNGSRTATIPEHWVTDWHSSTAQVQFAATRNTACDEWWSAGDTAPILAIAGNQDTIAPVSDSIDVLESELVAGRVTTLRLEGAGHALLPEQPERIATTVRDWLSHLTCAVWCDTVR